MEDRNTGPTISKKREGILFPICFVETVVPIGNRRPYHLMLKVGLLRLILASKREPEKDGASRYQSYEPFDHPHPTNPYTFPDSMPQPTTAQKPIPHYPQLPHCTFSPPKNPTLTPFRLCTENIYSSTNPSTGSLFTIPLNLPTNLASKNPI